MREEQTPRSPRRASRPTRVLVEGGVSFLLGSRGENSADGHLGQVRGASGRSARFLSACSSRASSPARLSSSRRDAAAIARRTAASMVPLRTPFTRRPSAVRSKRARLPSSGSWRRRTKPCSRSRRRMPVSVLGCSDSASCLACSCCLRPAARADLPAGAVRLSARAGPCAGAGQGQDGSGHLRAAGGFGDQCSPGSTSAAARRRVNPAREPKSRRSSQRCRRRRVRLCRSCPRARRDTTVPRTGGSPRVPRPAAGARWLTASRCTPQRTSAPPSARASSTSVAMAPVAHGPRSGCRCSPTDDSATPFGVRGRSRARRAFRPATDRLSPPS